MQQGADAGHVHDGAVTTRSDKRAAYAWLVLAAVILVAGGLWTWSNRIPAATLSAMRNAAPAVGHPAPAFTLQTLSGETLALADLRGAPVVLNFWATWCGPCRREMPALQATRDRYGARIHVLGIDQGEESDVVQAFMDEVGIDFTIGLDRDQNVGTNLYNVQGLPTTYFVDAEGVIRHVWLGEMNSITLEEGIAKVLR
jgi:peroxiredoxin